MGRIGRYEFPEVGFTRVLDIIKKFDEKAGGEATREGFADAINQSPKSSAIGKIISSLKLYGLAEKPRGAEIIKLTELAKNIIYGTEQMKKEAMTQAIMRIPLFRELYSEYGNNISEEKLRIFLNKNAGVDLAEAAMKAPKILKLFRDALNYVELTTIPTTKTVSERVEERHIMEEELPPGVLALLTTSEGDRVAITDMTKLKIARMLLDAIEARFKKMEESPTVGSE